MLLSTKYNSSPPLEIVVESSLVGASHEGTPRFPLVQFMSVPLGRPQHCEPTTKADEKHYVRYFERAEHPKRQEERMST